MNSLLAAPLLLGCLLAPKSPLQTSSPECFRARSQPVVRAVLVHYGSAVTETDLKRVGAMLAHRFAESTQGALTLDILDTRVVPLKAMARNLEKVAAEIPGPPEAKTPERLTRLWYYYNRPHSIADEIREEMRKAPGLAAKMKQADALLVLSEPQFEGLGYADGAVAITEQPTEIAWAAQGGGTTRFETDARLSDELLHELGHVLGLDHAAKQCDPSRPDYRQCCDMSPGGKDVMSYCRTRSAVDDSFYFGFTECTRRFLTEKTLPRLLNGKRRVRQTTACP